MPYIKGEVIRIYVLVAGLAKLFHTCPMLNETE